MSDELAPYVWHRNGTRCGNPPGCGHWHSQERPTTPIPQPMTDQPPSAVTARVRNAIGPNMLLGLQDAELYDEPGAQRIREWVEWIATAITPIIDSEVRAEVDRIRASVTEGKHLGRAHTASDVMVAYEVTRKQLANALDEGWHLNWKQLVDAAQRSHDANAAWFQDVQRVKKAAEAGPPSDSAVPGEWEAGWDAAMDAVRSALGATLLQGPRQDGPHADS